MKFRLFIVNCSFHLFLIVYDPLHVQAQWGESNDAARAEDAMSVMDNFFEDDSLESNSEDSGNDDDDDEDEDMMEDTDEIYKRYFGGRSWKGFSDTSSPMAQSQNIVASRSVIHRSIGPSSDMLQPVVTINVVMKENQNILLAKGWKLGRWDNGNDRIDADADTKNNGKQPRRILNYDRTKKGVSPFSRTMSVPEMSRFSEVKNFRRDPPLEENTEEPIKFLNKLFSHHQDDDFATPITLLSPPESKICKFQNSVTSGLFFSFQLTSSIATQ